MEIKSIEDFKKLDLSQVSRVYSGKANHCCCGCSGKYNESPKAIKLMYKKFLKLTSELLEFEDTYVSFETNTRLNIIYYK